MFKKSIDDRLSSWIELRKNLDNSENPLQEVWDFWNMSPFIPYNRNIDPYNQKKWPSPWEIIAENIYDDFTKSLMIAWTLKLTKKYSESFVELKTMIDDINNKQYNLVFVDNTWIINYSNEGPVNISQFNDNVYKLENIIEITTPR
jgi:hypothetical protein